MLGSIIGGGLSMLGSLGVGNNQANSIKDATYANLTPFVQQGQQANTFLSDFLMGNGGADQLARFADTTGMNFLRDQGRSAVLGNQAAGGSLNSGATGKALTEFGQNLAQTQTTNFLNQINGLAGRGASAGSSAVNSMAQAAAAQAQGQNNALGGFSGLVKQVFG